jgi:hypothetical protein
MSLFVCEECNVIENTATSRYWVRNVDGDGRALCSQCDPELGQWHGVFPRVLFDPTKDKIVDGYVHRG